MKRVVILVLMLAIIPVAASGCFAPKSPADVAKAFYTEGNKGDYAKAKGFLTAELRMFFRKPCPWTGKPPAFDTAMDAVTRGGTITRIKIEEGVEHPGFAMIMATLHYADGGQKSDILQLMKQDGEWRIMKSSLLIAAPAMSLLR